MAGKPPASLSNLSQNIVFVKGIIGMTGRRQGADPVYRLHQRIKIIQGEGVQNYVKLYKLIVHQRVGYSPALRAIALRLGLIQEFVIIINLKSIWLPQ